MAEHSECPRCERTQLADELCEGCGECVRCCECDLEELADFDADEMGDDPEDELIG